MFAKPFTLESDDDFNDDDDKQQWDVLRKVANAT